MKVGEHRDDLTRRLPFLRLVFVVAVVGIGSAYWFVQVVQGGYYRELAENNRLRKVPVKAPRGLIYDREGRLLVGNVPSYELYLDRSQSDDVEASLRHAAAILGRPVAELETELSRYRRTSRFTPVLIAEGLSLSQVSSFWVEALEHPEFEVDVAHLRVYRHGPIAAHLLGYVGEATESHLQNGNGRLAVGDQVGRSGVEQTFDERLRGVDGEREVVVDSRGRLRAEHGSESARPGADLRLTLDLDLQQEAARFFADRVGAAVALDPRNGEILALISAPAFEPNRFARRLRGAEWEDILAAPHQPLQNRALSSEYPPGSIFKIVIAVAGLNDRVVGESDRVWCPGSARIYNRRFRCWQRNGHGWVNLHEAIRDSCDVYFYHLGQKLGIGRIARYARLFGLGSRTGVDAETESSGLVPDLEWSQRRRGEPWYPGETISVAIGQGPLLVTPLQVAAMMATLANGGRPVTPYLELGREPEERPRLDVEEGVLTMVRESLLSVVGEGTGTAAGVAGLEIAGKTGTAQVIEQKTWVDSATLPFEQRDHAWFASFGDYHDPELVVVVFVEHGGKGSTEATPLAKTLYEKYYGNRRDNRRPL